MADKTDPSSRSWLAVGMLVVVAVGVGMWYFFQFRASWPRGEALGTALKSVIEGKNGEQAFVARVIWENYLETRTNASRWSGLYWGLTFAAALSSALAALILKLETIVRSEAAKKDVAALLSVAAALLITISTSGDFQRKWQANRIAAAELESAGYEFLENDGADARAYLGAVRQSLLRRHMAIVGGTEQRKPPAEPAKPRPNQTMGRD